ncbi:MAG: hypothetical protein WC967_04180 [Balneolaceae bacterium]
MSYILWTEIPVTRPPGVLTEHEPIISTFKKTDVLEINGYEGFDITPVAKLSGEVRVIEKERYFFDPMSSFSSLDVLTGWNELSDQRNLEFIRFSIDKRQWSHKLTNLPLPVNTIREQTALFHLIPSSPDIKKEILNIRKGHIIKIEGTLVNVVDKEGLKWETSSNLEGKQATKNQIVWVTSLSLK